MAEPWFERWPDLLEWELERFAARDLLAEIDEEARAVGQLVLRSSVRYDGEDVAIEVRYPSETPELPPTVFGPPGLLDRHEHAFNGNFCLLERPLDDWPAGSWGAADLIADRLTALLADSEAGPDAVKAAEAPMPEPYSAYYNYPFGAVALMPGNLFSPLQQEGTLEVRQFPGERTRFFVTAVGAQHGDPRLLAALPEGDRLPGRWKRVQAPPPGPDAADLVRWLRKEHAGLLPPQLPPKLVRNGRLQEPTMRVVALVFPEEGPGVGETRDAWLFVCVPAGGTPFLAHCQVSSVEERGRRTPELLGLTDKRLLIVGLGTLGGDVAFELAKAGAGHLDLVDFDRYEVNNSVRHVLGVEWSGVAKTEAIGLACQRVNPYCLTNPVGLQLGAVGWDGPSPLEQLTTLIEQADLVVETTGSHQLQRLVGRVAQEAGAPFVSCWLTAGFYGAHVMRIIPGRTSCFLCSATAMANAKLLRAEVGPDDHVVARGCSHPTVPGAGFDAAEAAAVTARLAVQTVLGDVGYADCDWDHVAISFRRNHTDAAYPRFATEKLMRNEECPQCSSAVGSSVAH